MKKRIIIFIISITSLLLAYGLAHSDELIFSDDFERSDIGEDWITGAFCDSDTITIVDGRVQATENCNYIETVQEFSDNLRIEMDLEKVGSSDHTCWDFGVLLKDLNQYSGIIRFDWGGVDGVAIGPEPGSGCGDNVTIPSGVNKGKAIFTYQDGTVGFSFENDDGEIIDAGSAYAGNFDSSRIKIHLAAHPDTPRYVDNVKVYSLSEQPGPAGYTYVADEGESVTFTETVDVAYGANGQFNYLYGVTGTITFDNATFGDPIFGVEKAGFYRSAAPVGPAGYTYVADEGESVTFTETVDVAYGANGQFYYLYGVTGTITFDNATFGDPIFGVEKAGFYRSADPVGLIASYPFNGNANDESGNGNDGTVHGAILTEDRFGNSNSAYSFDGIDDHIHISETNHPKGEVSITYAAWIYLDEDCYVGVVIDVGDGWSFSNKRSCMLILPNNCMEYVGEYNDVTPDSACVTPNKWTFIAITKSSRNVYFYINGELKDQGTTNIGQNITNTQMNIGLNVSSGEPFYGVIDDISIYSRALSEAEINALYNLGN